MSNNLNGILRGWMVKVTTTVGAILTGKVEAIHASGLRIELTANSDVWLNQENIETIEVLKKPYLRGVYEAFSSGLYLVEEDGTVSYSKLRAGATWEPVNLKPETVYAVHEKVFPIEGDE